MIIPTKDQQGNPNGYLHLLWNANEQPDMRPDQVYLTVIAPGCCKGPHLHYKRRGWFHVIKGEVAVRVETRLADPYIDKRLVCRGDWISVPAGYGCCLYNIGQGEAWVVNMPSPAYDPNDPDEHVPEHWQHPDWWLKMQESR